MYSSDEQTEVLRAEVARFPRARLTVVKGADKGQSVVLQGQTVVVGTDESCQLVLHDSSVSRRHLELSGGPGGYRLRDLRSTNGVFIEGVQVMDARLLDKVRLTVGRHELRFEPERHEIQWPLSASDHFGEVLGRSVPMRRLFALLERAAATDATVLLEGEPGTGREALARALHAKGTRREAPLVVVALDGAAEAPLEADLFGTAARPGALEEAGGGTLYLDEVSALSLPLQQRLVRALESGELKRPGGPARVDVRVVASTRVDLDAAVKAGAFREDLLFALGVFRVHVPALRERREDVPDLVRHFEAQRKAPALTDETVEMLSRHDWPGNVRELRLVLERLSAFPDLGEGAVARALGRPVEDAAAAHPGQQAAPEVTKQLLALPFHEARDRVLESFEKTYLVEHLRAAGGVVTRAALKAGLPRQSFHRMLRRLGLGSGEE